jgi:sulfide:quinone oxidoreductase
MLADDHDRTTEGPTRVLVAGGGVAALELLLALRVHARSPISITLLSADEALAPPAMTVAAPFGRGGAQTHAWAAIAADLGVRLVVDRLVAVETATRTVFTHGGRRIPYDVLVLATGARRVEPLAGALTFGIRGDAPSARLRELVAELVAGRAASIAFALAWPSSWSLPLYELALLTAHELREHGSAAVVRVVTPETHPLELLGPAAREAVEPLLSALRIETVTDAQPRAVVAGGLLVEGGGVVEADHVVTLADVVARPIAGLPIDRAGFVPVDRNGRVVGERRDYAAGEVTSFPLRQGGIAAQQADAVAETIAARLDGAAGEPATFEPVLRGRLTTSGAPLYLQARPSGQSLASYRAMWSPPEKVAGRYLAPYLASARPPSIADAPLAERVPVAAVAGAPGALSGAVTLALSVAAAEDRCHNRGRALQALDAAGALEPGLSDPRYLALRERLTGQVPVARRSA